MKNFTKLGIGSRVFSNLLCDWFIIRNYIVCESVKKNWDKIYSGIPLTRDSVSELLFGMGYSYSYLNSSTIRYIIPDKSSKKHLAVLYGIIKDNNTNYCIYLRPMITPFNDFIVQKNNREYRIQYVHELQNIIKIF